MNTMSEGNSAGIAPHEGVNNDKKDRMQSADHEAVAKIPGIPHSDSGIGVSPQTPEDQGSLQCSPSDITVTPQSLEHEEHSSVVQSDTVPYFLAAKQSTLNEDHGLKKSAHTPVNKNTSRSQQLASLRSPGSQQSPVKQESLSESPRSSSYQVTDAGDGFLHRPGGGTDDPLHLTMSDTPKAVQGNASDSQPQGPSLVPSHTPLRKDFSAASSQHHRGGFGDGNPSSAATRSPRRSGEFGNRSSRSPRPHKQLSMNKVPPSFTYETKYVVLQFLQQATTEENFVNLSQSSQSQSSTSESESRWKVQSNTQKLRAGWQNNRSASQPSSPKRTSHPLAKTKGNRSSPNLKDANFFKEGLPSSSVAKLPKSVPVIRLASGARLRAGQHIGFVRSVSDYTEPSENGDADDELDTSFDSSQNGSVVSHSLKDRMANVRASRLPTVLSESEAMTEYQYAASNTSDVTLTEETQEPPVQDEAVSLDMIQIEDTPLSPLDAFNRVHRYLAQMNEHSQGFGPSELLNPAEDGALTPDTTLLEDQDEVDSPPFNRTTMPEPDPYVTEEFQPATTEADIEDDGNDHPGFYQSSGSDDQNIDTEEGAVGGRDGDEEGDDIADVGADNEGGMGRGNRESLRLDLPQQEGSSDPTLLVDAVLSLQQELEEEMSSFESEFEEAMQNILSDSSLGRSRSVTPETAAVARRLKEIGDSAQHRYFSNLEMAVGRLLISSCAGLFTYENFRQAAMILLENDSTMDGWRRVSILLLYSQHVALHMAQLGRRGVHRIVDYTVRLLADTAAEFIVEQGGWAAISSLSSSSSSEVHSTGVDPVSLTNLHGQIGPLHNIPVESIHSSSNTEVHSTGVDPINFAVLPGPDSFLLAPFGTGDFLATDGQSVLSMEVGGEMASQQGVTGHMHDLVGGAPDALQTLTEGEAVPPTDSEAMICGDQHNDAESAGVAGPGCSGLVGLTNAGVGSSEENTGAADLDNSVLVGIDSTGATGFQSTSDIDHSETTRVAGPDCVDGVVVPENTGEVVALGNPTETVASENQGGTASPGNAGESNSIFSIVHNIVTNPRRAASYAVSVGIVAVGAAVVFGFQRG